jgi:hypothetical protein
LNVYAVPFVKPVTTCDVTSEPTNNPSCAVLPTNGITTNPDTGFPPSLVGATHDTVAEPFPRTATTDVGTPGTVAGTTTPEDTETKPVPSAFVAATLNVYAVPFTRPVTTRDVDAPVKVIAVCAAVPTYGVTT